MSNVNRLLWLRAETKPFEQRTMLTPDIAVELLSCGYEVVVERSEQRIFDDKAYSVAGCRMVEAHAWQAAPQHAIILGLKELEPSKGPFTRRHVHFAHVFKDQLGWQDTLLQFKRGGGVLYDLEYLTDDSARRIAAFGYWAGFIGAAVAILAYCAKQAGLPLAPLAAWSDKELLIGAVQHELSKVSSNPSVLVIGALGRCGKGAQELLSRCGIDVSAWDKSETAAGGPFDAVRDHDVLVNCVFVNSVLPPFTTLEHLQKPSRRLQVISDVSCDPFGQYNPLPIVTRCTSMERPVMTVLPAGSEHASLDVIAIDHLPSLLPRESSEDFSSQLLSTLKQVRHLDAGAWRRAEQSFNHHVARLPTEGTP